RCCDGPFGAVSPLLAPSWFTALPRTTARIWCPLRWASESRSTTSTPMPSAMPMPSAPAPNALHRPSEASAPCWPNPTNPAGGTFPPPPPASATVHSPDRSDWHAGGSAVSEEEHAVSPDTAGPSSPSVYDTRPDSTLDAVPVSRCAASPRRPAPYPDELTP